jgi:CRP-like cAMP-binding protein
MKSPNSSVKEFFTSYPVRAISSGQVIIHADDTVPPVHYLENGKVMQYAIAENGSKVIVNIFKPGAFFPMSAALNNTPNTLHFFEAVDESVVYTAPAQEVVAFLESNPAVTLDLLKRVYRGTDGLLRRLVELMSGTAQERLLAELSITGQRFGVLQPDGTIRINITENQLAEQTGLARETISKELRKLEKDGTVSLKRGIIFIRKQVHNL